MAKLIQLTKQAKLASIDEDKADEADQGDWGSWTANKHKADEADGRRLTEVCPRWCQWHGPDCEGRCSLAWDHSDGAHICRPCFEDNTVEIRAALKAGSKFTPLTNFSDGSRCTKEVPEEAFRAKGAGSDEVDKGVWFNITIAKRRHHR